MTAKMILNPYSSRWTAGKRREEAEAALREAGVEFESAVTEGPEHGIELATEAAREGFEPIIAAGGDGTIGEVVNGIMKAAGDGKAATFGVMPLGTANDLVDNLGMPNDLGEAAKVIASGKTQDVDICRVNERYFVNNAGLGLEPFITTIQERMTAVKGIVRYLLATLTGIAKNPQWRMNLEWDDGGYEGPVTLISVGNAPRTGGIFYTVPHADPFDGKLTFVFGYIPKRLKILGVLPRTMKAGEGNYVEHPAVHEVFCTCLKVRVEPPTPAHTDGELFTLDGQEFEYRVFPGRLPILTGR